MMPMSQDVTLRINLADLYPNPWNPHDMTEEEQNDLEQSVFEDGQWRSVVVVEMDQADEFGLPKGKYRIIDGEHLYDAVSSLYMQGRHDDTILVLVAGKNSELPVWKQQEIGQTINHGLRGSVEDARKTQAVMKNILNHRAPEVVAKRFGLGVAGIKHLSTAPSKKTGVRAPAAAKNISTSVKVLNPERKAYTIALVFDSSEDLKALEDLVELAASHLEINKEDYKGQAGKFRVATLMGVLNKFSEDNA